MVQTAAFASIFYGLTIVWERESGILKKLLTTPASRYFVVIGRSMASGVRAVFQALIVLPVAVVIGVRLVLNPAYFVLAFIVIFLASGGSQSYRYSSPPS
jgi:ABC-2 type transport system permease protein